MQEGTWKATGPSRVSQGNDITSVTLGTPQGEEAGQVLTRGWRPARRAPSGPPWWKSHLRKRRAASG